MSTISKNKNRRSCATLASEVLVGIGAGLIILGGAGTALAQSESCPVAFSVSNAATPNALQFLITHAGPAGRFASTGACSGIPAGISDVVATNNSIDIAWADQSTAFAGPGVFATCNFIATSPPAVLAPANFTPTIEDCSEGIAPPTPCAPAPTITVSVGACTPVAAVCGNGVVEVGEDCDGGPACTGHCTFKGSCGETPLAGCKGGAAGGAIVLIKNATGTVKDSGGYTLKKGDATVLADFKDPTTAGKTISWCVYDDDGLVAGLDVASGGTGWTASGTKGFSFKSTTDPAGVSQIKLTSGAAGKASVSIKTKSKTGDYTAPALPLTGTVTSQLVIDDGLSTVCFSTDFSAPKKNDAKQFNSKGP